VAAPIARFSEKILFQSNRHSWQWLGEYQRLITVRKMTKVGLAFEQFEQHEVAWLLAFMLS
jgi:hypothetical protein